MFAADTGDVAITIQLMQLDADIGAVDDKGKTALHYATICEQVDVAEVLLEAGADPEVRDANGSSASGPDQISGSGSSIVCTRKDGRCLLLCMRRAVVGAVAGAEEEAASSLIKLLVMRRCDAIDMRSPDVVPSTF